MKIAIGADHAGFELKELQTKFGFTRERVIEAAKAKNI